MWIIAALALAGFWFWRSNQRRAQRFVRAVCFLDMVDGGASVNDANGLVVRLFTKHSTPQDDETAIAFAIDTAQRLTDGKQLPWIHEAREKGFVVDSGNTRLDMAHASPPKADDDWQEDVYVAAGLHHVGFLHTIKRDVTDAEFTAAALGAFDGTVQALGLKPSHIDMMAMGSAFAYRQLKDHNRVIGFDPEWIADLTVEAMTADALEEMRVQASQFAYAMNTRQSG